MLSNKPMKPSSAAYLGSRRRSTLGAGVLLLAMAQAVTAQQAAIPQDSAPVQIRAVLRAYYFNLENRNWEALAAYVLSPKLLERRGSPGDLQLITRDRARARGSAHAADALPSCPASISSMVDQAAIRLDGDWAEVSVPRCRGASSGVDEFRMLYFEERWRFIYTGLFEGPPSSTQ
jgi:hypothetical protein